MSACQATTKNCSHVCDEPFGHKTPHRDCSRADIKPTFWVNHGEYGFPFYRDVPKCHAPAPRWVGPTAVCREPAGHVGCHATWGDSPAKADARWH